MAAKWVNVAAAIAILWMVGGPASAADRETELKDRFKERLPQITQLKRDGKIGETFEGYLAAVNDQKLEEKTQKLVDDENADRKETFKLIADRRKTTVELVGENFFYREYKKAPKGNWFKLKNGGWKQKEKEAGTGLDE